MSQSPENISPESNRRWHVPYIIIVGMIIFSCSLTTEPNSKAKLEEADSVSLPLGVTRAFLRNKPNYMIDFIGDIHGHAWKLKSLLVKKLGYQFQRGTYRHPERTVIFVGDYIDRGPNIVETLDIVKRMVDAGNGIALMGNHEYNAICFHMQSKEGGHLRPHLLKNVYQHLETIKQFHHTSEGQRRYEDAIEWFKTLPLFYESDKFRAVHACWDVENISLLQTRLNSNNTLTDDLIYESINKENELYVAIEETLKGKEIPMPSGQTFADKDNHSTTEVRIKWWEDPVTTTYRDLSIPRLENLPHENVHPSLLRTMNYYSDPLPVFFGHYWLNGDISLHANNICCLDYSVARDGVLAAYRFDGEPVLEPEKFVFV